MVRHFTQSWFANKDYLWIYLHRFFFMLATASGSVYGPAYFLDNGMGLPLIILSVAVYFAVSGMAAPFTFKYINRIGVPAMMAIAVGMNIISIILLAFTDRSLILGFLSAVFGGITCGTYYPVADMLEGMYLKEDAHRGRQYTFSTAMAIAGTALGAALGAVILQWSNFYALAATTTLFFLVSLVPFFRLAEVYAPNRDRNAASVLRYMRSREYRGFHLPFFGAQLGIIAALFVPLFVFMLFGNYQLLGIVTAASTCIELLAVLLFGHQIDNGHDRALGRSAGMNALGMMGFIFLSGSALSVFMLSSWNRIATNAFDSSFLTMLHKKAYKSGTDPILFGTAFQVSLCLFEVLTLAPLALLAVFIGNQVFTVIFAASASGLILARHTLPKT